MRRKSRQGLKGLPGSVLGMRRSMGGGHPILVCFSTQDSSGTISQSGNLVVPNKASSGCVAVVLERCRYAVRPGETMQHIAAYYATNWIQVPSAAAAAFPCLQAVAVLYI